MEKVLYEMNNLVEVKLSDSDSKKFDVGKWEKVTRHIEHVAGI